MKTTNKVILAVAATAIAATVTGMVIHAVQRKNKNRRLSRVSDEGYETAHDVLFPTRNKRRKSFYGQEYTL
jgi:hypothetical protein